MKDVLRKCVNLYIYDNKKQKKYKVKYCFEDSETGNVIYIPEDGRLIKFGENYYENYKRYKLI